MLDRKKTAARAPSAQQETMVLMRGLPSCGKTTKAKELIAEGGVLLEFDEYFYTQVGDDPGSYDWSSDLLPRARRWNAERIQRAVDAGVSPIIVDSDNMIGPFTRGYVEYASSRGFRITFQEPDTPWWRTIRTLLEDKVANAEALRVWAQMLAQLSTHTHRVPLRDIVGRINRWEATSVERILTAG